MRDIRHAFFVLNVQYFQSRIQRVTVAGQKQHATIMDVFKERFENIKLIQLYRRGRAAPRCRLGWHVGGLVHREFATGSRRQEVADALSRELGFLCDLGRCVAMPGEGASLVRPPMVS